MHYYRYDVALGCVLESGPLLFDTGSNYKYTFCFRGGSTERSEALTAFVPDHVFIKEPSVGPHLVQGPPQKDIYIYTLSCASGMGCGLWCITYLFSSNSVETRKAGVNAPENKIYRT